MTDDVTRHFAPRATTRNAMSKQKTAIVEIIPIEQITPDPRNARRHGDRNANLVETSIKRFGPARSVVLDRNNTVRAGNQTIKSAASAGVTKVAIVEVDDDTLVAVRKPGWDEVQATAYGLVDNRATDLSEFDGAEALRQLDEIDRSGTVSAREIGFDEADRKDLIEQVEEVAAGADLQPMSVKAPPTMAWVLVGIPLARFGEIAELVERIAGMPDLSRKSP